MGETVSMISGDGTIDDWNVERASARPDAARVSATARAMTAIRIEMSCGLVRKVERFPFEDQDGRDYSTVRSKSQVVETRRSQAIRAAG